MSKKYLPEVPCTIVTNDLFLAAFLCTVGCALSRIERNQRRRVSFVFTGERVAELREAYRTGPVRLDLCAFRENLNRLRDRLGETIATRHPEERSAPHAFSRSLDPEQSRTSTRLDARLSSLAHA